MFSCFGKVTEMTCTPSAIRPLFRSEMYWMIPPTIPSETLLTTNTRSGREGMGGSPAPRSCRASSITPADPEGLGEIVAAARALSRLSRLIPPPDHRSKHDPTSLHSHYAVRGSRASFG